MVATLLISACGFQMQGAFAVPDDMQRTYVATEDRYSLFYRKLTQALAANGVEVVETPAEATATLAIVQDRTDQRVLSVSARNVPTEFEVYYSVRYRVNNAERQLLDTQDLTLTRDYTYDETLVLGKANEEQLLREAIVDDLVRIVLKQLGTL